jgi:lysophospholipase L1-like esterase
MKQNIISSTLKRVVVTLLTFGIFGCQNNQKSSIDYESIFKAHYDDRVNLFIEENKTAKDVDVVFLGDSLTELYDVVKHYPEFNVLNRGIGGDTSFGVEKRLKESVFDANPKVTAMLIGANNQNSLLDNYEKILQSFKQNAPDMKVVLLSLTSMTLDWGQFNKKAKENNVEIKEYANTYGYEFVNLYDPLLDENTGELKSEYTIDGGHLTDKGYEIVTNQIKPVLHKLLD